MKEYSKNWAVRKSDKTPLVDQLVNNIRWSIFTGEIRFTEKLPPIRTLAQELGIGINTVRRAYKKLEEQSLVVTRPHIGTVVQMEDVNLQNIRSELVATIKSAIHYGLPVEDIRSTVKNTLDEYLSNSKRRIIFVYADPVIGRRHAEQIAREVDVLVQEVPLDNLIKTLEGYEHIENLDAIVTTYFTYARVQQLCPNFKGIICGMTVEISKEVIGVLNSLKAGSKIALFCRKDESAEGFINLIKRDYPDLHVEIRYEKDLKNWPELAKGSAAVFSSPCLMKKMNNVESGVRVYEIWNRLNAQSIQMLKEHLY